MIKVSCPNCGVRLSAPDELLGKPVNCQKCQTKFVLSKRWTNEPLSVVSDSSQREHEELTKKGQLNEDLLGKNDDLDSALLVSLTPAEQAGASMETDSLIPIFAEGSPSRIALHSNLSFPANAPIGSEPILRKSQILSPTTADVPDLGVAASRTSSALWRDGESASLIDFFDFRFHRYLTPGIVRVSWFLILVAAMLWILLLSYLYVSSLLQRSDFHLPEIRIQTEPSLDRETSKLIIALPQLFYNALWYATSLLGSVLALLWTRVLFETVIMVFSIGDHLQHAKDSSSKTR